MQCQINYPVLNANHSPIQSLEAFNNSRPRSFAYQSLLIRCRDVRDLDTSGWLESHRCFITVCENVDKILKIVYEVLLHLQKAACRLLHLQPPQLKCTQPLPDLLKDLQPTKMTLRNNNNNPDVIPYASRRCLASQRHVINNRPRDDQNTAVHSPCDLSDSHKSDNRHYYHHGHVRHHNNNNKNSHLLSDEDDNGNRVLPLTISHTEQNSTRHSFHHHEHTSAMGHRADIENNNSQTQPRTQKRNSLEDITNQELNSQNAISIHVSDVSGNHSNGDGYRRTARQSRRCLMVPGSENDTHQRDNLRHVSPLRQFSPSRSVGPMRQLSPMRTPSPCRHGLFETGMVDQAAGMFPEMVSDNHDHESTKDIILALRCIGDNLEHKIKHHNQPSVQAIFGGKNLPMGHLFTLVLGQRNVVGWAINASLRLLLLYNQL